MRHTALIMLILLLIPLTGCQFTQHDISLIANTSSGHPTVERDGFPVIFSINGVGNQGKIDYGDGQTETVSDGKVVHVYKQTGQFAVVLTRGGKHASVTIAILNNPPRVRQPQGIYHNGFEWHEFVKLHMAHRYAGCENGTPQVEYGAYDPDGDPLTFRWSVVEDNGKVDTIFAPDQSIVTNKDGPYESVCFFAGYDGTIPPFPFAPFGIKCAPTPIPPDEQPAGEPNALLTVVVSDPWGGRATFSKRIYIARSNCTKH